MGFGENDEGFGWEFYESDFEALDAQRAARHDFPSGMFGEGYRVLTRCGTNLKVDAVYAEEYRLLEAEARADGRLRGGPSAASRFANKS